MVNQCKIKPGFEPGFELTWDVRYKMFRKGTLLKIIVIVALIWLVRSFFADTPESPAVLILILGFFVAVLLLPKTKSRQSRKEELPPSQRRNRKNDKHKSWITRIDEE